MSVPGDSTRVFSYVEDGLRQLWRAGIPPRSVWLFPLLSLLAAYGSAPVPPDVPDVSRWRQLGAPIWRFGDGLIAAGPQDTEGFLVSNRDYSDFRLSIEFRIEDDTNSGVFVRCLDPSELADVNPDNCYEINIWDNHPNQDFRSGSIVKYVVPAARVDTLGKWNLLVIQAIGNKITVVLNGVVTATMTGAKRSSGVLALQYAGDNRLKFRNLTVEPL